MSSSVERTSITLTTQRALDRARLGPVRTLQLYTGAIHDLGPLRRAAGLTKLVLDETAAEDLTPIAQLGRLEVLHLFDNARVRDLSLLGRLTALASLEVGGPRHGRFPTRGLGAIAALRGLRSLILWCPRRANLQWLTDLRGLETLIVHQGCVRAEWLGGLTALRTLDLTRTQTSDLGPLAKLRRLEDLWLCGNRIEDVRPLRGLRRLTRLLLLHNAITDLAPLMALEKLVRLDAHHNAITRLPAGLARLTALQTLDLGNNRLTRVAGLAGLKRLDRLDLRNNALTDLRGLGPLPRLRSLVLTGNRIRDLRPLAALGALVSVEGPGGR